MCSYLHSGLATNERLQTKASVLGVIFTSAVCQQALFSPSMSSILEGSKYESSQIGNVIRPFSSTNFCSSDLVHAFVLMIHQLATGAYVH